MINQICKTILSETSKYNISQHTLSKQYKQKIFDSTSSFPEKISLSKRIGALANNAICDCKECGYIHGDYTKDFCSTKCYNIARKRTAPTKQEYELKKCIVAGERKYKNKIEGYDYQVCQICTAKTGDLGTHIQMHNISSEEYKSRYNVEKLKPQKHCEIREGKNNPGYQHGGKFSAWSENFIHGYDHDRHLKNNERQSAFMKNYEDSPFKLSYWMKKTDGDEELAKELYSKSQTRDLEWFVNKYGEEEGQKRHKEKIEKWTRSFKKTNFSMISQELFDLISKNIDCTNIYYATFCRDDMKSYMNKEYILELSKSYVRPDFIDIKLKKIIEFDGEYWHSPAIANPERERNRDTSIKEAGYEILHVKEYDYKRNKEKVIKDCIEFLIR